MTIDEHKIRELHELRARVQVLEAELADEASLAGWPPQGFYSEYYATTGALLGMLAAAMSLLANVIGAPIAGKSPLELIRVYLTFPLGEKALQLAASPTDVYAIGDGVILAIGCCLYLGTGMILGVPFFITLVRLTEGKSTIYRILIAIALSIVLWVVNFWGILSWLQPLLFEGRWITDSSILPSWVALMTHIVFGLTLAVLYPLGRFQPYSSIRQ